MTRLLSTAAAALAAIALVLAPFTAVGAPKGDPQKTPMTRPTERPTFGDRGDGPGWKPDEDRRWKRDGEMRKRPGAHPQWPRLQCRDGERSLRAEPRGPWRLPKMFRDPNAARPTPKPGPTPTASSRPTPGVPPTWDPSKWRERLEELKKKHPEWQQRIEERMTNRSLRRNEAKEPERSCAPTGHFGKGDELKRDKNGAERRHLAPRPD